MNILLLSNKVPYPANDGSSIAIQNMADGLLANGVNLTLLSINTLKHYRSKEDILNSIPDKLNIKWVDCNTNITLTGILGNLLSAKAFHVSRFWQKNYQNKLEEILQENSFDIVQLEGLAMAVYIPFIRKHSNVKISFRAHNAEFQIWERTLSSTHNPLKKAYLGLQVKRLKKFEEQTLQAIDALVTITPMDFEIFKKMEYGKAHITIPCGIKLSQYESVKRKPDFDISYLASFDWLPNLQGIDWFLDKVWPIIRNKAPQITMALAGRKMPKRLLYQNSENLTIRGEVDNMQDFITNSKINIVPLLAGSGMRIKIVENMALSRPMVSTNIGAEGIEVENGTEILLEDEPEQFADAIIKLVTDTELQNSMGLAARKKIESRYDNKVLGKQLMDFYQSL